VAATHTRAGAPPSATGRSPAARRPPPWCPSRGSCRHDARVTLLVKLLAYKNPSRFTPCARLRLPRRLRPPLPPLGEHHVPVDFLVHPRAPALPCESQHLPEPRVDQAKPPIRRSLSLRGRRRTATVELAPPPLLQAQ
jgi:hypothetical protein